MSVLEFNDGQNMIGDTCACGNQLMRDAIYCRKCGASRGNPDLDTALAKLNRWDTYMESNQGTSLVTKVDEPRTLEIAYCHEKGNILHEIVYEDPSEEDKRPRLLVSLQSVLALKALCEREFDRVEVITNMLKHCRTAYFKELQYLRDQLKQATQPNAQHDGLENYEVYWYDPPEYIDSDMKEFLQDCIRLTNKKLIEENFELVQKLKACGEGNAGGGDDAEITRMIRTLGPGGFVRKMYGFLLTPEHGSPQKIKDFEIAVNDLLRKDNGSEGSDDESSKLEAKIRKLQNQIEKLQKQNAESDALRKRVAELEAELAGGAGGLQQAAMEAARADMEKARADELEAKAQALESELDMMRSEMKKLQDNERAIGQTVSKLCAKIDSFVQKLDPNARIGTATSDGPLSPLEISVSTLEGCMNGVVARLKAGGGGSSAADQKTISDLMAQLKSMQDQESKMKDDISRLQAEAKRLKTERDTEAAAAAAANAKLAAAGGNGGADPAELAAMKAELRKLREDNERLNRELEDMGNKSGKRMRQLEQELAEASEERNRLKALLKGSVDLDKLAQAEENAAELGARLAYAQQKIQELKGEIRKLKTSLGMEVDDASDDSNYDDDMPMFLMSYVKRTRHSMKPRWQHLSDDAKFGRQKRDFVYAQAHAGGPSLGQEDAAEALDFLHQDGPQRDSSPKAQGVGKTLTYRQERKPRHRSHSTVLLDNQEPVLTAMRAHDALGQHMLVDNHLLAMSQRTGHPVHRFEAIADRGLGGDPTLEAALAFRGAAPAGTSLADEMPQRRRPQRIPTDPPPDGTIRGRVQQAPVSGRVGLPSGVPPMVVCGGQSTPVHPMPGMGTASASHQAFNRGRETCVARSRSANSPCSPERASSSASRGSRPESREIVGSPGGGLARAGIANGLRFITDEASRPTSESGRQRATAAQMGALEAIAASGPTGAQTRGLAIDQGQMVLGSAPLSPLSKAGRPQSRDSQTEVYKRMVSPPVSPTSAQRIRSGGLLKMETPTEWSVVSRNASPSPPRIDESGHGVAPVAAQRLLPASARSGGSSQRGSGSPGASPSRAPSSSPAPRGLPKEAPTEFNFDSGPSLADLVAYSQSEAPSAQADMAQARMEGSMATFATSASPPVRNRSTAMAHGKRNFADPLPTEVSTSSVGSCLPAQDSITSTVGSVSSAYLKNPSSKQGGSRAPASRTLPGKGMSSSAGFAQAPSGTSLRSMLSSSAGFNNGAASSSAGFSGMPKTTVPGGGMPKGPGAEFSVPLGFGSPPTRSATAQAPRTSGLSGAEGTSPHKPMRTLTAGGQRDVTWGSRSTGSLPLTNTAGRNAGRVASSSPMKPKCRLSGGNDDKAAKAELAAAHSEGHLPELLPAFKPGRIQKGPKAPSWLVAI